jgi:hypothetical protein
MATGLVYDEEQKQEIRDAVLNRLERSFEVNRTGKGTPLWLNIIFMLDLFNRGNYYGTLLLKILGTSCNDVREQDVTHKLSEKYREFDHLL